MLKSVLNRRLLTVLFICVALQGLAFGDEVEVVFNGAGKRDIIVDEDEFKFKVDFSGVDMNIFKDITYYGNSYYLDIGGCGVQFWGDEMCPKTENHEGYRFAGDHHIGIDYNGDKPRGGYFHDTILTATVTKESDKDDYDQPTNSKIRVTNAQNVVDGVLSCNINRQASQYPDKALIEVKIRNRDNNVDPNLVTTFYEYRPPTTTTTTTPKPTTTTLAPTTTTPEPTTTTTAPTTTTSASTTTSTSSTTLKSSTSTLVTNTSVAPALEKKIVDEEFPWWIIVVAVVVPLLLLIISSIIGFFLWRRHRAQKQKEDTQTVTTVSKTVETPIVKEKSQYGPDMMYFARDAKPVDPKGK